jgi:alkyl hydroperoxide reductase subunit AhpC
MIEAVFRRIREHEFHPLDDRGTFTIDRLLGKPGVASMDDTDGRVRSLAIRDLTSAALRDSVKVATGLSDEDLHVRCLSAAALGVAQAVGERGALERVLVHDPEPIVRTHAAIALGEAGARSSSAVLCSLLNHEAHPDVRHQVELAVAQLESVFVPGDDQLWAFMSLDAASFGVPTVGGPAPDFVLDDVQGWSWRLRTARGRWVVLIWVFADWCPVCHGEFHELMELRDAFVEAETVVVTIEAHDTWRARLMVGREVEPALWGSKGWFREAYTERIWWPHLMDRAGVVGARYGTDPLSFAVHGEFVNRPTTVIVDPAGVVRFVYRGTYWGDRPSIEETLKMVEERSFEFVHPQRLSVAEE